MSSCAATDAGGFNNSVNEQQVGTHMLWNFRFLSNFVGVRVRRVWEKQTEL